MTGFRHPKPAARFGPGAAARPAPSHLVRQAPGGRSGRVEYMVGGRQGTGGPAECTFGQLTGQRNLWTTVTRGLRSCEVGRMWPPRSGREGDQMRRTTAGAGALARTATAALCALMAVCALAGCSRPEPEPYEWPTETGTPTPTATWDAEQARAINAVQRYIDLWAEISQNLETADWIRIYEVADDPAAQDAVDNWVEWAEAGLHFVGAPVLTVDSVVLGYFDSETRQYHVGVCYDRTNAYLVHPDGTRIAGMLADRTIVDYTTVISPQRLDRVLSARMMEGPC